MGDSPRDNALSRIAATQRKMYDNLEGLNTTVPNRFDNYSQPFGYEELLKNHTDSYDQQRRLLKGELGNQAAQARTGVSQRLASQGITGGSIFNQAVSQADTQSKRQSLNALNSLGIAQAEGKTDLQKYANESSLRNVSQQQATDFQNVANLLAKYGAQSNILYSMGNTAGQLDNTNWGDVLGPLLAAGAKIGLAIASGGASAGAGAAASTTTTMFPW